MAAIATQAVAQDFAGLKLPQLAYLCGCYGALRVPAAELFDAVAERVAPLLARWPIRSDAVWVRTESEKPTFSYFLFVVKSDNHCESVQQGPMGQVSTPTT